MPVLGLAGCHWRQNWNSRYVTPASQSHISHECSPLRWAISCKHEIAPLQVRNKIEPSQSNRKFYIFSDVPQTHTHKDIPCMQYLDELHLRGCASGPSLFASFCRSSFASAVTWGRLAPSLVFKRLTSFHDVRPVSISSKKHAFSTCWTLWSNWLVKGQNHSSNII